MWHTEELLFLNMWQEKLLECFLFFFTQHWHQMTISEPQELQLIKCLFRWFFFMWRYTDQGSVHCTLNSVFTKIAGKGKNVCSCLKVKDGKLFCSLCLELSWKWLDVPLVTYHRMMSVLPFFNSIYENYNNDNIYLHLYHFCCMLWKQ